MTVVLGLVVGTTQPVMAAPKAGPGQWFIKDYGIDKVWKKSTGKGVKVAVIDSGVNTDHEDLKDVVTKSKDFSGLGKDGKTPIGGKTTIHHGTAVAGVIAGRGVGAGPTGVAPDAEILSASMWLGPDRPKESGSTREQADQAIRWAVDSGAKVINMSLG
ncbi:MAG: S8 family serine peptidase, partial [Brevibacterium linens]